MAGFWAVGGYAALTERGGESGTLLYKTLERKLLELNPVVVTPENVREVIERIESARIGIEGNYEILRWLRGEQTVKVASEKRHRNVTLVDYEHLAHNTFHVTDEWRYTNGQHANRADVMFALNGIPVAIVETKHAKKADAIDRGLKQIRATTARHPSSSPPRKSSTSPGLSTSSTASRGTWTARIFSTGRTRRRGTSSGR